MKEGNMKKSVKEVKEIRAAFRDMEEAAEFWGTHSLSDYEAYLTDVEADIDLRSVRHLVALEGELLKEIAAIARSRGVSAETLINLWLKEKLAKTG